MNLLRRVIHFVSRKIRYTFWSLRSLGCDLNIDSDADVSILAQIDATDGLISIAKYVLIDRGVLIRTYGGIIRVGPKSTIGPYSCVYGGGTLSIGGNVRIGPHVCIVASNHNYEHIHIPIYQQGMACKGIIIHDDVWIGAGSIILDGVTIGEGCVVGAGSVVTKSISPYTVVAGVPARKIKNRGTLGNEQHSV